jgi:hypothetical protein
VGLFVLIGLKNVVFVVDVAATFVYNNFIKTEVYLMKSIREKAAIVDITSKGFLDFTAPFRIGQQSVVCWSLVEDGSCGIEETLACPPNFKLVAQMFPDVSAVTMMGLAEQLRGLFNSWWITEEPEAYSDPERTYSRFTATIEYTRLYAFYLEQKEAMKAVA